MAFHLRHFPAFDAIFEVEGQGCRPLNGFDDVLVEIP